MPCMKKRSKEDYGEQEKMKGDFLFYLFLRFHPAL